MGHARTLWTIGHSTRDIEDFIALLSAHQIKVLADVRSLPGSRKYPQFNKEDLEISLKENDIAYVHLPGLGGRRKPVKDSKNTVWHNLSFRSYADYMETPAFAQSAIDLMQLASAKRTCIMCSEAVWWRCHRSMIADYFKSKGWKVLHILSLTKVEEHPYTRAAKIIDGKLAYGGENELF